MFQIDCNSELFMYFKMSSSGNLVPRNSVKYVFPEFNKSHRLRPRRYRYSVSLTNFGHFVLKSSLHLYQKNASNSRWLKKRTLSFFFLNRKLYLRSFIWTRQLVPKKILYFLWVTPIFTLQCDNRHKKVTFVSKIESSKKLFSNSHFWIFPPLQSVIATREGLCILASY